MIILEDTFEGGIPAFFVMLGAVVILAFIRLVMPWLIARYQTKRATSHTDKTK